MTDAAAVTRYFEHVLPDAVDVAVHDLRRIVGGASRQTWSLDLAWRDAAGEPRRRGLIVRLDPGASLLDTDRALEFAVYRGLAGSDIPVPEALWFEPTGTWLGGPFLVLERVDGCETRPQRMFAEPYAGSVERLGRRLFEIGGRIAAFDWRAAGWEFMDAPAPEDCWRRELAHWERVIEVHRSDAQPVTRAAIDRLRRHPPPPAQRVAVVHGDFRTGNVLYDEAGAVRGVLDWEMCHLGDPLEDLAWTCMPNWRWGRSELAGGVLPPAEAHREWERASGLRVDPGAYAWWEVFAHVKAQGIWITGARNFADGKTRELNLAWIATRLIAVEDRALIARLGADARRDGGAGAGGAG
ncbi:MAG: phosphotransferase family protein [Chloroflexi bacterium]|nr:phosphotransferase family protein [Chloroflexota bacterium]